MAVVRRLALHAAVAVAIALLAVIAGVVIVTRTDWGREQVRRIAVEQLNAAAEGDVRIGRVEGNLLSRVRLVDVSIVDEQGRPFVRADTLATGFSLRGLLRRRLIFDDMRLVRAVVVLDQPPGEDWNWVRIFPGGPEPVDEPDRAGWGDWIELHDLTLVDSRVMVRTEWEPPEELPPTEREEAVREALAGETRDNVVTVPGGYQNVMDFRGLEGALPLVRPTHPDGEGVPIEVARLRGVIQPFRPPAAVVEDLAGRFLIARDSLFFDDIDARLPGSRVAASGVYAMEHGELHLRMQGAPAALADFRWLYPPLPEQGGGDIRLALDMRTTTTRIAADGIDLSTGQSTLAGRIDLTIGDTVRLRDTDLRFERVHTRLIERLAPRLELPRQGELTGRVALAGPPDALRLDGEVSFADRVAGTSRLRAEGRVGFEDGVRFDPLWLRVDPLQAALVRAFVPDLPLRGIIAGAARLDGAATGPLRLDADLTLRDPGAGVSRVLATGGVDARDPLRLQDLRLRFDPLRLDLLREQLPQLPPAAVAVGQLRLDGVPERALQVDGDLTLRDPATGVSRVAATGGVAFGERLALRDLRVRAEPLQLDLLRAWIPELPAGASASGRARVDGEPERALRLDVELAVRDPATGLSRVAAAGGVRIAESFRLDDLRLRFDPLHVDLLRERLPELPPGGTLAGDLRLDGAPQRMLRVDGSLTHRDPLLGVSRVVAAGGVGVGDTVRFHQLALHLDPLRLELVRAFAPELPLEGVLQGTATVTGSPATRLGFHVDLAHRGADGTSRVDGPGEVVTGTDGRVDVDLQLQPLSLATIGRFVPGAGLRGSVSGRLQARGDLANLAIEADLRADDGGELAGRGTLDLASERIGYTLYLQTHDFDLAALTALAPAATDLTGTASARGRGTEPATMRASFAADLEGSAVDDMAADRIRARLEVDRGLARIDEAVVRLGAAEAELRGSFGLVAGRTGELVYRVAVDSLHAFATWVPGADTAAGTPPAAAPPAETLATPPEAADARFTTADPPSTVVRTGGTTRVQYAGAPDPERLDTALAEPPADSTTDAATGEPVEVAALPPDSLAGRLEAEGTIHGNIEQFDIGGRVAVEELAAAGASIGSGQAEFALAGVGTPQLDVELDARARAIQGGGFRFDSATARVRYAGARYGGGRAALEAHQDGDTDLRVDAEFDLALERNEVRLDDLAMRFDTVVWRTTRPGAVGWGGAGIEIEMLELASSDGGRLFVDGRLPAEGAGELEVVVERFEIGHAFALLQDDGDAAGRLDLDATLRGTRNNPRIRGEAQLREARFDGRNWPDTRADFDYGDRRLTATAQLLHEGRELAAVQADLPVDLALTAVDERLLGGPLTVDVRADSIPLDVLPTFTDQVTELRGRVRGQLAVRGSLADPALEGTADLDLASFHLVPTGVRYRDIAGSLRLQGDVLAVDSLVARADGPIRVTGRIDLPELTRPVLDLTLAIREAWMVSTDDARLQADADLEVTGPLTALRVEGEVHTQHGVIYIPELEDFGGGDVVDIDEPRVYTRIDTLFAADRERLAAGSPLLDSLQLDLAVHVDRDVWLRSTEANVEIYTPAETGPLFVRMDRGPSSLALEGTINTDRGTYEFMSRRFALTRGAVTFLGEPDLNPFLQLVAEHEVRLPGREGFEIRVILDGTLRSPSLTLESSAQPPISQTDLLSFLAFGREASTLLQLQGSALSGQAESGGGLVGNVAALATQQLAAVALDEVVSGLERDLAREVGLDVLRITPGDLPPELFTGTYADLLRGTELETGTYLTSRLYVAGEFRPTLVRPGVRLQYRIPGGFQWQVAWSPRFLASEPTLREQEPERASVLGSFLFREWRF